jgi:hypothetical protein
MEQNCVLCGKEVQRGGYSSRVGGVVLRPVCADCDEKCSKEPERVVKEHGDVFEQMLVVHREALAHQNEPLQVAATPQRSQREVRVVRRYDDAYLVANATVVVGKTIKVIGAVLAGLIVVGTLLSTTEVKGDATIGLLLIGAIVSGVIGLFCYALGTLVKAQGQMVQASLDGAVNTSPFLTDELRAEIMSV